MALDARPMEEREETKSALNGPRFLIVRFSAIGDCVMAAWTATAIRNRYPNAWICWAAEDRCLPVIDQSRLVDELVEIPRQSWRRQRWTPKVLSEQIAICRRLKSMKFDFGIDLQGHLKTAICLRFACPKRRVACCATDLFSRSLNPVPERMPPTAHWVEWQNHVLQNFGEFDLPIRPIMPKAPVKDSGLVTISTSAGHSDKIYPASKWKTVAQGLQSDGMKVAFLGAPGDPEVLLDGTTNFVGKLGLGQSMEMVAASELHLSGDTGTGHMAAAYGVPVVSVFGHMDPANYRPYTDHGVVLKVGSHAANVDPEAVIDAARMLRVKVLA